MTLHSNPNAPNGYPSNSESVAGDQLRAIIERVERLDEEITALNTDKRDVYAEAKGNGFDTKVIKHIVRVRKQDHSERMEFESILDIYMAALGMDGANNDE